VVLARDGLEALDIAETLDFDVLLTDLAMPRVTGWELISRLRARRADLPVVVMTGYLPPGGGQALFADKRGPTALLHKPFALGQLFAALGRVAPERAAIEGTRVP
jgi:CheY-like chemotaxis protein